MVHVYFTLANVERVFSHINAIRTIKINELNLPSARTILDIQ